MQNIYVVTGQTATGKTTYALNLARKHHGVLISSDSRQIYKELTIVSGKDVGKSTFVKVGSLNGFDIGYYLIDGVQLYMYNVLPVTKAFSSFDYVSLVKTIIDTYIPKDKAIIMVGGTYLYLEHFFYGFGTDNIKPDFALRNKLNTYSIVNLQNELKQINPDLYSTLNNSDINNPHRLIRKIEISLAQSQTKISMLNHTSIQDIVVTWIGLKHTSNELLEERIKTRVLDRVKNGAILEMSNIVERYNSCTLPGISALGCAYIISYLKNEISEQELIEKWSRQEIQYAKRQYTFMKKNKNIQWEEV